MFRAHSFFRLATSNSQLTKNTIKRSPYPVILPVKSFSQPKRKDPYWAVYEAQKKYADNKQHLQVLKDIEAALDGGELSISLIDKATELAPDATHALWNLFKKYILNGKEFEHSRGLRK